MQWIYMQPLRPLTTSLDIAFTPVSTVSHASAIDWFAPFDKVVKLKSVVARCRQRDPVSAAQLAQLF